MSKHTPEWTGNPHLPDSDREALAARWTNSIYRLRKQLAGRARKALEWDIYYLETYSGFGVPVAKDGKWALLRWLERADDGFVLTPLVPSDAKLHQFFGGMIHRPSYWENPRAIFLPPDRISSTWRAIILHHELGHSMFHRLNIHRDDGIGNWAEEYEVYSSEVKLVRAIYGELYSRLVRKLSKSYERELRSGTLRLDHKNPVPHEELAQVFGKPHSTLERNAQRSAVVLDALYRALDRIRKDGNKSEHHRVTKWFCKAINERYALQA